jgi:hypothetical protein
MRLEAVVELHLGLKEPFHRFVGGSKCILYTSGLHLSRLARVRLIFKNPG